MFHSYKTKKRPTVTKQLLDVQYAEIRPMIFALFALKTAPLLDVEVVEGRNGIREVDIVKEANKELFAKITEFNQQLVQYRRFHADIDHKFDLLLSCAQRVLNTERILVNFQRNGFITLTGPLHLDEALVADMKVLAGEDIAFKPLPRGIEYSPPPSPIV